MSNHFATITKKFQFTIPKQVCTTLRLKPGQKLSVSADHGRIILTPVRTQVEALAGSIQAPNVKQNITAKRKTKATSV